MGGLLQSICEFARGQEGLERAGRGCMKGGKGAVGGRKSGSNLLEQFVNFPARFAIDFASGKPGAHKWQSHACSYL